MNLKGNTILITGGATGLGLAMAEQLIHAGNEIIICGRRADKLQEAKNKFPTLHTRVCDVRNETERTELITWATTNFKGFNMLINNAGIQNYLDLKQEIPFGKIENEITTNITAPIHLCNLVVKHFSTLPFAAIVNITSGLAYIPLAVTPIYAATKAAIHTFGISLRHQLKNTSIKVFEIIPPIVDTHLDRGERDARRMTYKGITPEAFAIEAMDGLKNDEYEWAVGQSKNFWLAARTNPEEAFEKMNNR